MKLTTILKQPRDEAWALLEELAEDGFEMVRTISPEAAARKRLRDAVSKSHIFESGWECLAHQLSCPDASVKGVADFIGISPYFVRKFAKEWNIPLPNGKPGPVKGTV